jgi:antibiotic biosynthesis monooxygenase (ABM) superfamily enzyme
VVVAADQAGRRSKFEGDARIHPFCAGFPGNRGINVVRPGAGSREYTVVDRFADARARQSFKASSDYREGMHWLFGRPA